MEEEEEEGVKIACPACCSSRSVWSTASPSSPLAQSYSAIHILHTNIQWMWFRKVKITPPPSSFLRSSSPSVRPHGSSSTRSSRHLLSNRSAGRSTHLNLGGLRFLLQEREHRSGVSCWLDSLCLCADYSCLFKLYQHIRLSDYMSVYFLLMDVWENISTSKHVEFYTTSGWKNSYFKSKYNVVL